MENLSQGTCTVNGCDRPRFCKGMCGMHYARVYRLGSVELPPRIPRPRRERPRCHAPGCGRRADTSGLCSAHYVRTRLGKPLEDVATAIEDLPGEEWRLVPHTRSQYAVSNLGRVRSLPHYYWTATRSKRWNPGRVLKPNLTNRYLSVEMTRGHRARVHVLVAAAFLGPRPEAQQVNHINGNRLDNRAANLEYVTGSENMLHAFATHLQAPVRGERHGNASISEQQARFIWRMKGRITQRELAALVGCSVSVVADIHSGRRWRHVRE